MNVKSHLQFYLENRISPVGQKFKKKNHFQRRESLYNYLGLTKEYFKNKTVLEDGTAEGHNSTYIASLNPKELNLLEPNPFAYRNIRKVFKKVNVSTRKTKIITSTLEKFKTKKKYDIVICEAWLGISSHERKLMVKLSKFVKKGGLLVVTAASPIGYFSNIIRRYLANEISKDAKNFKKKTKILVKAFAPHLKTMKNMSCPFDHWVQDSLIGSGFLSMHPTPKMIFADLGKKFDFYNSYPAFNSDWRWYKDLYGSKKEIKYNFLKNYYKQCHNFLDYRNVYKSINPRFNIKLENEVQNLMNYLIKYERNTTQKSKNFVISKINKIYNFLKKIKNFRSIGILEAMSLIKNKKKISAEKIGNLKKFKYIFGRELLYLSLLKIK